VLTAIFLKPSLCLGVRRAISVRMGKLEWMLAPVAAHKTETYRNLRFP
jgi:hypothetical protein